MTGNYATIFSVLWEVWHFPTISRRKRMQEKKRNQKNTIQDMPPQERPYEKGLLEGPEALSDRQLLAVILRSGVSGSR